MIFWYNDFVDIELGYLRVFLEGLLGVWLFIFKLNGFFYKYLRFGLYCFELWKNGFYFRCLVYDGLLIVVFF